MNDKQLALRPAVGDLAFQLYDRPLHPELFESLNRQQYTREGYVLRVDLLAGGHVICWRRGAVVLTEVLAEQNLPLPGNRQLFSHRLAGERVERHEPHPGIRYETAFQVERATPELFYRLSDEIRSDGERDGVLHLLAPHDRLGLSPLALIDVQARIGSLLIQTYHTFPDDHAIVKVQTLIDFK